MGQNSWGSRLSCDIYSLGLMPFAEAWTLQKNLMEGHRNAPQPDRLLLVEHPGVYTLGQGSTLDHLKVPADALPYPLFRIERGGEVTHHCPGQLVGYPILNLKQHQPDLHWYLRQLEEVLIQTLAAFGVTAGRQAGLTGVWVSDRKLAAIGIKVSRWVTMHGFALNVCPDLRGFDAIAPCGITDKPVGSLAQFCPGITVEAVHPVVIASFAQVFNVQPVIQNAFPPGL